MANNPTGTLWAISAPSGTGKTTLVRALTQSHSNIVTSISHTTRPRRLKEQHGVNYFFVADTTFQNMIDDGEFLEYARIFEHLYGTSRKWVEQQLAYGKDVILEIDWQGYRQVKASIPACKGIFILPPRMAVLESRLHKRNQDDVDVIRTRLASAQEEMRHYDEYDYVVVNKHFRTALKELKSLLAADDLTIAKQAFKLKNLLAGLLEKR